MMEKSWPELIPHVSSCKSPHMMVGSAVKRFFGEPSMRSGRQRGMCAPCRQRRAWNWHAMHNGLCTREPIALGGLRTTGCMRA